MHIFIIRLPERGFLQYLPQNKRILHLFQAHYVRQPSRLFFHPEQRFRKGIRLRLKPLPDPVALPRRRELQIRNRRGIVPPVKEILHVPKHHGQRIFGLMGLYAAPVYGNCALRWAFYVHCTRNSADRSLSAKQRTNKGGFGGHSVYAAPVYSEMIISRGFLVRSSRDSTISGYFAEQRTNNGA